MLTTLLAFVFVLGVLIFVHELGHFLMAKRIGIRVLTFSLGFGPKILSFRRGDTDYCIGAIPLGGYVKMAGENPGRGRAAAQSDEFLSKSKWQRFQVLIMGPVMNIAAGGRADGGRADARARGAGLFETSRRSSAPSPPDRPREARASGPAIASWRWPTRRSRRGSSSSSRSARSPTARCRSRWCATATS